MADIETTALKYVAYGCDDIGIMYSIEYSCPYCNNHVKDSGLEGYGEVYSDAIFYSTRSYCPHCQKSCIVRNPESRK